MENNVTTQQAIIENPFVKLAAINVSEKIEKKGNLSYLSWAWAVDQLMRVDPTANWEYHDCVSFGKTMMVSCSVTALGKTMRCHLPVMDNRNKPIAEPDAFAVNTAMQRCLVKCIALHGLGLYIYAGEDLPEGEEKADATQDNKFKPESKSLQSDLLTKVAIAKDKHDMQSVIDEIQSELAFLPVAMQELVNQEIENRLSGFENNVAFPPAKHKFAGVNDAIAWMTKMKPVTEGFKSTKALMDWQSYNQPWIDALDALKAEKYKKDDKYPKERFTDALRSKYDELSNLELSQQPLAAE